MSISHSWSFSYITCHSFLSANPVHYHCYSCIERGKRDVYCDKQVEEVVTVLNCMLKGSWGEKGSGGIRKKLKSRGTAYL